MPSRPDRLARYPADWPTISARIRVRAAGRCECTGQCGLHHDHRCIEEHLTLAQFARGRVVLTVAHVLNPDPTDCRDENLLAMCNRCHLRLDVALHVANSRETRLAKKEVVQPLLFPTEGDMWR